MSALRKKLFYVKYQQLPIAFKQYYCGIFFKKHFSLTKFNSRMHMSKTYFALMSHGVIIMDKNFLDLKRKITIGYYKIMQALG